jgi:purine-binding chemotaxis protein CheW
MTKNVLKLVTFKLAEDLFALPVDGVERVLRYRAPSPVPDAQPWVAGVIDHGERVVPVVDLRRRLSLESAGPSPDRRIILLRTSNGLVGLIVDSVVEVSSPAASEIETPPPMLRGLDQQFLRGFVRSAHGAPLVVILDAERVLSSEDRLVVVPEGSARV